MQPPRSPVRIPEHFHFIWFGSILPDFARVAIRSALETNPGASATLWHEGLQPGSQDRTMGDLDLELCEIDAASLFDDVQRRAPELDVQRLREIYACLRKPAARANVIRMVVLFLEGGIYLDTDTLTLKSFRELRRSGAFCGEERILWPAGTWRTDLRPLALSELRRWCALLPKGYRWNRHLHGLYSRAANNAVFGARSGHPLLAHMLSLVTEIPSHEWKKRYRLGTHLLQEALAGFPLLDDVHGDGVRVLPPDFFYPVGPRVSRHYFKRYADAEDVARELLHQDTHVIHWYASVSDLTAFDAAHIVEHERLDVYSHLCRRHVADGFRQQRPRAADILPAPAF